MKAHLRAARSARTLGPAARLAALVGLLAALACGGRGSEEQAAPGTAVDLRSAEVMVLPVQRVDGVGAPERLARRLDAEIEFWTGERAPGLRWTFPGELARVVLRTPQLDMRLEALPVAALLGDEDHIPDPLLGQLRGLGAVVSRRLALVPYQVELPAPAPGTEERRLRIRVALIDTHGGRVLWRGTVNGEPAPPGDAGAAASVARALAERLIP